jgi:hypothetical protein
VILRGRLEYYAGGDDGLQVLPCGSISRSFVLCGGYQFAEEQNLGCDGVDTVVAVINHKHLAAACIQALLAAQLLRQRTLEGSLRGSWFPTAGLTLLAAELQLQWLAPGEAPPTEPGTFFVVLHGAVCVQGTALQQLQYCVQKPSEHYGGVTAEQVSWSWCSDWSYRLCSGGSLGLQLLRLDPALPWVSTTASAVCSFKVNVVVSAVVSF